MSFDGVHRPSQLNAPDPLSPYTGAYRAEAERRGKPQVKSVKKDQSTDEVNPFLPRYNQDEEEANPEWLSEEEQEQVLRFAKIRGLLDFSFKHGTRYRFQLNETSGFIELVEEESQEILMSLTVDELTDLFQRLDRYMGVMTDREG
ncbi:MAG: hypothetical protein KTR14_02100 [Vampirovibrio sp.]|nr:hypothetical protein [Vampirovibrio sp.]